MYIARRFGSARQNDVTNLRVGSAPVMGIYTTMYLGPSELGGPDNTARNGWAGMRRNKVFKG